MYTFVIKHTPKTLNYCKKKFYIHQKGQKKWVYVMKKVMSKAIYFSGNIQN